MELLGQTRDDAAGEAFDKVAKLLGLGYPGGAVIESLAAEGDPAAIKFPRALLDQEHFDFSFSGLKTAVARHLAANPGPGRSAAADIAAGFQQAVLDVLVAKLIRAARRKGCTRAALVGGVAANGRLREALRAEAAAEGIAVYIPAAALCGDNAAMVAAAGYHLLKAGVRAGLEDDVYSRSRT
jgi:N6-L-threonylcarbamoyladenine synthase